MIKKEKTLHYLIHTGLTFNGYGDICIIILFLLCFCVPSASQVNPGPGNDSISKNKNLVCFQNMLDAYLDRNYYTSESHVRVLVSLKAGKEIIYPVGMFVSVELPDGNAIDKALSGHGETEVTIALKNIPEGESSLVVRLIDTKKTVLESHILTLRKYQTVTDGMNKVKIDHENRCLLVNGESFFPIGICDTSLSPEWLRVYRDIGFNSVIHWIRTGGGRSIEDAVETLYTLQSHGLRGIIRQLSYVTADREELRRNDRTLIQASEDMRSLVKAVRKHPNLLLYYGMDEPPRGKIIEGLQACFKVSREMDPYHPVYITGGGGEYSFADILGLDPYWDPMAEPQHRSLNHRIAADYAYTFKNKSEPEHRPLFAITQAEITSFSRRGLTPAERRATVYLSLINGAKSLIYFRAPIRHRATLENMKELAAEIKALAPALLRQRIPHEIVVTPASHASDGESGRRSDLPVVQALIADRPEGGSLLIAANSNWEPVNAAWNLRALGGELRVSDFFAKKSFSIENGILNDRFEGYDTRVYLIEGTTRKTGEKTMIRLALEGPALAAASSPIDDFTERKGKNKLFNSSFEDAALPGWPDSWWFEGTTPELLAGDPGGPGQDSSVAYDGTYSLRIVNPATGEAGRAVYRHRFEDSRLRGGIPVEQGKKYVFSAYMRAEKEGILVEVDVCNYAFNSWRYDEGSHEQFEVTTEWKRYEVVVEYPKEGWTMGRRPDIGVVIWHRKSVKTPVWVDAVQFEEGDKATPYEP